MTYQELLSEIEHLSINEKLLLLENLVRVVRQEVTPPLKAKALSGEELLGIAKPNKFNGVSQEIFSVKRVRGMLKPDGLIPTDEEVEEILVNALIEKHLK